MNFAPPVVSGVELIITSMNPWQNERMPSGNDRARILEILPFQVHCPILFVTYLGKLPLPNLTKRKMGKIAQKRVPVEHIEKDAMTPVKYRKLYNRHKFSLSTLSRVIIEIVCINLVRNDLVGIALRSQTISSLGQPLWANAAHPLQKLINCRGRSSSAISK